MPPSYCFYIKLKQLIKGLYKKFEKQPRIWNNILLISSFLVINEDLSRWR